MVKVIEISTGYFDPKTECTWEVGGYKGSVEHQWQKLCTLVIEE